MTRDVVPQEMKEWIVQLMRNDLNNSESSKNQSDLENEKRAFFDRVTTKDNIIVIDYLIE